MYCCAWLILFHKFYASRNAAMTSCLNDGMCDRILVASLLSPHLPFLKLLLTPSVLVFAVHQVATQHNCARRKGWQNKF